MEQGASPFLRGTELTKWVWGELAIAFVNKSSTATQIQSRAGCRLQPWTYRHAAVVLAIQDRATSPP
jgi:hypothetical protein